jgi:hypothetical protein
MVRILLSTLRSAIPHRPYQSLGNGLALSLGAGMGWFSGIGLPVKELKAQLPNGLFWRNELEARGAEIF